MPFSQLIANGILAGANYALMALGFGLILSTVRFLPFSHAIPYTTAAYSFYVLNVRLNLPLWIAILLSITNAALVGALIETVIYRSFRARNVASSILLLVSLGLVVVFQSAISLLFGDQTQATRSSLDVSVYHLMGSRLTSLQTATVIVTAAMFALVWVIQQKTGVGQVQRALASNPALAKTIGINISLAYAGISAVGSGLAGVAGILAALDTDIVPTMGFNALMMGIAVVIIGGVGSISGALWGGIVIGLVKNFGVWKLPTQWQDAIVFLILIAFLLVRPQGIFGKPIKKANI